MDNNKLASELLKIARNIQSDVDSLLKEPVNDIVKELNSCSERIQKLSTNPRKETDTVIVHDIIAEIHNSQNRINGRIAVLVRKISK